MLVATQVEAGVAVVRAGGRGQGRSKAEPQTDDRGFKSYPPYRDEIRNHTVVIPGLGRS